MDQELDDRKKKILKAIIKTYMETGEPVGSRTISKFADLNVSSATIRNEMSDLTDMGYIVQPHTSAGRIPSDKGYRLYVDELTREKEAEIAEIRDLMIEKSDKMDKVLRQVAKVLATNTNYAAMVAVPQYKGSNGKKRSRSGVWRRSYRNDGSSSQRRGSRKWLHTWNCSPIF